VSGASCMLLLNRGLRNCPGWLCLGSFRIFLFFMILALGYQLSAISQIQG
jgi:hypothetical protein